MQKFAKLLLALVIATSVTACEKDKNTLAKEYFESNVAAYGIYTDIGVDITVGALNNLYSSTDPKAAAVIKNETGNCTKDEFIAYVRATREAMNKALSRVIIEEIAKEFKPDELEKMTKFHNDYYDTQMRADMRELSLSGNNPEKAKALIDKISPEKKKAFKDYTESPLGNRELTFLQSLNSKLEAHKADLEKEKLPEKPACLVAAASAKAAPTPIQAEPAPAAPAKQENNN